MPNALPNATAAIQEFMDALHTREGVRKNVADVLRELWARRELGRQSVLARLRALQGEEDGGDGEDQTP